MLFENVGSRARNKLVSFIFVFGKLIGSVTVILDMFRGVSYRASGDWLYNSSGSTL